MEQTPLTTRLPLLDISSLECIKSLINNPSLPAILHHKWHLVIAFLSTDRCVWFERREHGGGWDGMDDVGSTNYQSVCFNLTPYKEKSDLCSDADTLSLLISQINATTDRPSNFTYIPIFRLRLITFLDQNWWQSQLAS